MRVVRVRKSHFRDGTSFRTRWIVVSRMLFAAAVSRDLLKRLMKPDDRLKIACIHAAQGLIPQADQYFFHTSGKNFTFGGEPDQIGAAIASVCPTLNEIGGAQFIQQPDESVARLANRVGKLNLLQSAAKPVQPDQNIRACRRNSFRRQCAFRQSPPQVGSLKQG